MKSNLSLLTPNPIFFPFYHNIFQLLFLVIKNNIIRNICICVFEWAYVIFIKCISRSGNAESYNTLQRATSIITYFMKSFILCDENMNYSSPYELQNCLNLCLSVVLSMTLGNFFLHVHNSILSQRHEGTLCRSPVLSLLCSVLLVHFPMDLNNLAWLLISFFCTQQGCWA